MRRQVSAKIQSDTPCTVSKPPTETETQISVTANCSKCEAKCPFESMQSVKLPGEPLTICDMVNKMVTTKNYKRVKINLEFCDSD